MKTNEAGGMDVIDEPEAVKQEEVAFTETHMGKHRDRWYLQNNKIIEPFSQTQEGKIWRSKLANGTLTKEEWAYIPHKLRYIYKEARTVKNKHGVRMSAKMYGDIFTSEITTDMMDAHISSVKKNTHPGKSGIRIGHVAALPDEMRDIVAIAISLPYMTGLHYDAWNEEIVNWIPKEAANTDIKKRRPIMYYEVLRKLHIFVKTKQVLQVWLRNGMIDDDNYAFLTGRTTVQPLMIKKMLLEDAKFYNKAPTMVDVDFSKAYDSTEKFAKDMSLRRLGFPQEGLDLWQQYDCSRRMCVLTAHGLTDTFTPECGAWGQGAPEAPIGWLALMCWMSSAIETKATDPCIYETPQGTLTTNKCVYADDSTGMSRTRQGAQVLTTTISDSASCTGTIVKPEKSYSYSTAAGEPLVVRTYTGKDNGFISYPLKQISDADYYRHLGNIQNSKGHTNIKDKTMHDGSTMPGVLSNLRRDIRALKSRNITGAAAIQVLKIVIYKQIAYLAQFAQFLPK